MLPLIHFVFSMALALGLFKIYGYNVIWILVGGVAIDFDHFIWYKIEGLRGNIFDAYKHYKEERNIEEHHKKLKYEIYIFHNIEFMMLCFVAGIFSVPAMMFFIGLLFHYILDWINEIWTINKVKSLSFFAWLMRIKKRRKEEGI